MSANDNRGRNRPRNTHQAGTAAVEFAVLAFVFFSLVLGTLELARAMYVFNTMYEATRYAANAASMVGHRDTAALDLIRQRAIFRASSGNLILGAPVNDRNMRIDYLALRRNSDDSLELQPIPTGSLPTCARQNREICMSNPHAANCIRFVRARICAEDDDAQCLSASFTPMVTMVSLTLDVPRATTVRATESFGSMPEGTPCL